MKIVLDMIVDSVGIGEFVIAFEYLWFELILVSKGSDKIVNCFDNLFARLAPEIYIEDIAGISISE